MQKIMKTRAGREVIVPTSEEDEAINAAALSDPNARPSGDAQLARLLRTRGRPAAAITLPK